MESNTGSVINLVSLYTRFQELHDKRKTKGKLCDTPGIAVKEAGSTT